MNNNNEINEMQGFGWEDEVTAEANAFIVLPAGDYPFIVTGFERKIYEPAQGRQSKIPAGINQATLELTFMSPDGEEVKVSENLYLYQKAAWKVSEFFLSIGQKVKGQPFVPNWQKVVGSRGMAKLEVNKYVNKNGQESENNRVKNFLEASASGQVQNQALQGAGTWSPNQGLQQPQQPQFSQPQAPKQNITPFPNAAPQQQPTGGYNF